MSKQWTAEWARQMFVIEGDNEALTRIGRACYAALTEVIELRGFERAMKGHYERDAARYKHERDEARAERDQVREHLGIVLARAESLLAATEEGDA